jgi:hypothetical protein
VFGRAASDAEVKAGLAFLTTEPLKAYEEQKAAKNTKDTKGTKDTEGTKGADKKATSDDIKAAEKKPVDDDDVKNGGVDKDDVGMMAGVVPGTSKKDEKKLLPATPWGRYVKILLSSNEFLFID